MCSPDDYQGPQSDTEQNSFRAPLPVSFRTLPRHVDSTLYTRSDVLRFQICRGSVALYQPGGTWFPSHRRDESCGELPRHVWILPNRNAFYATIDGSVAIISSLHRTNSHPQSLSFSLPK
mmetsp:Transcript_30237/g.46796  ORF Transcript_30237/g.46796 Transcript_30237/m.46796 type:complete len:120 (-) Transcript_30237:446-805(-)